MRHCFHFRIANNRNNFAALAGEQWLDVRLIDENFELHLFQFPTFFQRGGIYPTSHSLRLSQRDSNFDALHFSFHGFNERSQPLQYFTSFVKRL